MTAVMFSAPFRQIPFRHDVGNNALFGRKYAHIRPFETYLIPMSNLRHNALSLYAQKPFDIQNEGHQLALHKSHLLANIPNLFKPMSNRFRKFPLSNDAS